MYSSGGLDSFSSGTFWSQAQGVAFFGSPVDDILSKDDFTLEDILDEDTTIQETKAVNERLVDFLKEPQTLTQLLSYVACTDLKTFDALAREGAGPANATTVTLGDSGDDAADAEGASSKESADKTPASAPSSSESADGDAPPQTIHEIGNARASARAEAEAAAAAASLVGEDDDIVDDDGRGGERGMGHPGEDIPQDEAAELRAERLMRFPFIACEVICCNLTQIVEPIVNSADLLSKFFSLLDANPPLDSRLAGYFFKILMVLLRRAPEKILWFSIYRNIDISRTGCEDGIDGIGWLMPKLLKHIDSYSVMCCFKSLLQVAAGESALADAEDDEEDDNSFPGYGQGGLGQSARQIGDLDGRDDCDEETRNALMRGVRSVWLGGNGAAQAVLRTLAASDNSDSHNNAAELLADMIHRAAMARLALQQTDAGLGLETAAPGDDGIAPSALDHEGQGLQQEGAGEAAADTSASAPGLAEAGGALGKLPTFSAFVLVDKGVGPNAETAMIESGVEWTLELCRELLRVALFESASTKSKSQARAGSTDQEHGAQSEGAEEEEGELLLRTVERGSAAVASLQVLTHLVSAFALERWSEPTQAMMMHTGDAHMTTTERHGTLPAELDAILNRLDDLTACLLTDKHAKLFGVSHDRASRVLGMHRLRIVELTCMLVHTKYPAAIERVAASQARPLAVCLDLFFQFEWNNCLHSVVERTLQFCLRGGVSEESIGFDAASEDSAQDDQQMDAEAFLRRRDGITLGTAGAGAAGAESSEEHARVRQDELAREQAAADKSLVSLQQHVFEACKLVDLLLAAYRANRESVSETETFWTALEEKRASGVRGKLRSCGQRGYIGFCHRIVNTIALVTSLSRSDRDEAAKAEGEATDERARPALEATEGNAEWNSLLEGEIADINAVEQCLLGGMRPRTSSIPTSEGMGGDMDDFDGDLFLNAARAGQRHSAADDDDDDDDDDDFRAFGAFSNPDAGVAAGVSFEIDDDEEDDEDEDDDEDEGPSGGARNRAPEDNSDTGFNPFGSDDQTTPPSSGHLDPFGAHFNSSEVPFQQEKHITGTGAAKENGRNKGEGEDDNAGDDDDDDGFAALAAESDPFVDDDDAAGGNDNGKGASFPTASSSDAPEAPGTTTDEELAKTLDNKLSLEGDKDHGGSSDKSSDWVPDFS